MRRLSTSPSSGPVARLLRAATLAGLLTQAGHADNHLLLSEIKISPDPAEFIEIINPTARAIALDDYYLCDDQDYALLPGAFGATTDPEISTSDMLVRFPAGASLEPGGVLVVAIQGAGFLDAFGVRADFEVRPTDPLTPDMVHVLAPGAATLAGGECMALFQWDGASDLVRDVDLVRWGSPLAVNDLANKTGLMVDGPDADTSASTYLPDAFTMEVPGVLPGESQSIKRLALEDGVELSAGGNGITGHDETSESILSTWDFASMSAPTPGESALVAPPAVDLKATITGPGVAAAGSVIELSMTLENIGTLEAAEIALTCMLPGGTALAGQSSEPAGLTFDQLGGELAWSAPSLAGNAAYTIAMTVDVSESVEGSLTFVVVAGSASAEDDLKNNESAWQVQVVAPPPAVVINEIHFDPHPEEGDANGDGRPNPSADEFVELINLSGGAVDLSGYEVSDGEMIRHVFPGGSVVEACQAIIVFGGGVPFGSFGGALVQTASTGALNLDTAGDTVTLRSASGLVVASATFDQGDIDQSIVRDPELTGEAFVPHTSMPTSGGALFSPGTRVDFTVFDSCLEVPACLGDLVTSATFAPPADGVVDGADLAYLLGGWGANPGSIADLVTSATFAPPPDGVVDGADLAVLLGAWGSCE